MKGNAIQLNDVTDSGTICSGLVVGPTTEQNKAILLIIQPGELKERPTIGVGFNDILLGDDLLEYRHKIRKNFAADGLKITELNLYKLDDISIKATY